MSWVMRSTGRRVEIELVPPLEPLPEIPPCCMIIGTSIGRSEDIILLPAGALPPLLGADWLLLCARSGRSAIIFVLLPSVFVVAAVGLLSCWAAAMSIGSIAMRLLLPFVAPDPVCVADMSIGSIATILLSALTAVEPVSVWIADMIAGMRAARFAPLPFVAAGVGFAWFWIAARIVGSIVMSPLFDVELDPAELASELELPLSIAEIIVGMRDWRLPLPVALGPLLIAEIIVGMIAWRLLFSIIPEPLCAADMMVGSIERILLLPPSATEPLCAHVSNGMIIGRIEAMLLPPSDPEPLP